MGVILILLYNSSALFQLHINNPFDMTLEFEHFYIIKIVTWEVQKT